MQVLRLYACPVLLFVITAWFGQVIAILDLALDLLMNF